MKLGTRGSTLALWQAREAARLIEAAGGPACEIVVIRTSGDEPAAAAGDPAPVPGPAAGTVAATINVKALFVKEIEEALLAGRIDAAVHSSKDLPAVLPDGLVLGAALRREDPRDAMLLPATRPLASADVGGLRAHLGARPRIGTSSVRRTAQLRALLPEADFTPLRGNVDTRLRKLDALECDAAVLAAAGLRRLGLEARIALALPVDVCLPAPGQGIIALETRVDRLDVTALLSRLNDRDAAEALTAERALVRTLGGSCQMPLGALARPDNHELVLTAIVLSRDGARAVRYEGRGPRRDPEGLGEAVAQTLLDRGAGELLEE